MRYALIVYVENLDGLMTFPQRFQALGCKRAGLRKGATG